MQVSDSDGAMKVVFLGIQRNQVETVWNKSGLGEYSYISIVIDSCTNQFCVAEKIGREQPEVMVVSDNLPAISDIVSSVKDIMPEIYIIGCGSSDGFARIPDSDIGVIIEELCPVVLRKMVLNRRPRNSVPSVMVW